MDFLSDIKAFFLLPDKGESILSIRISSTYTAVLHITNLTVGGFPPEPPVRDLLQVPGEKSTFQTIRRFQKVIWRQHKGFQNVSKEGLKLGRDSKLKKLNESFEELTDWWTNALSGEHIGSVKISNRLDDTPCVVVVSKY